MSRSPSLPDEQTPPDEHSSSSEDTSPIPLDPRRYRPAWWGTGEYPPNLRPLIEKAVAQQRAMASIKHEDVPARRRRVAMALIDGYNAWDIEKIMEPRAPDCTHQLLPASLKRPQLSYQTYKDFFAEMIPQFRNVKVTVQDIFDDAAENKVAISCLTTADTDIGPYNNEYIFLIYLNKECTQIVKILEYVDSAYTADFLPRLRAHRTQATSSIPVAHTTQE